MRQKVGKERSQEGAAPLANPRRYPNLAEPSCEPPPAGKSYELRRVARPARGGGGSRDPTGRRFSTCRPIPRHPPPKTTQPNGHWPRAWAETSPWRPVAHPLEALQNPGWSAQRHRGLPWGGGWPERPYGSQLTGWTTTGLLSQARPSRGESISFLSPARAAEAPTFCDATESRQRTQPRGLRPLGHPPTTATRRKFGLAPTPLRLCKTPVGVPSGTAEDGDSASRYFLRPRLSRELTITGRTPGGNATSPDEGRSQPWRGGWPERPNGSQLSYWPTNSRAPAPKNRSAQRSLSARQRNLVQTQNMRLNDFAL